LTDLLIECVHVPFQPIYGYVEADNDNDNDDDKIETCPPLQGRTRDLLHPIPHRNDMRCLQLVAVYDMQEGAGGLYSSPEPAWGGADDDDNDDDDDDDDDNDDDGKTETCPLSQG